MSELLIQLIHSSVLKCWEINSLLRFCMLGCVNLQVFCKQADGLTALRTKLLLLNSVLFWLLRYILMGLYSSCCRTSSDVWLPLLRKPLTTMNMPTDCTSLFPGRIPEAQWRAFTGSHLKLASVMKFTVNA